MVLSEGSQRFRGLDTENHTRVYGLWSSYEVRSTSLRVDSFRPKRNRHLRSIHSKTVSKFGHTSNAVSQSKGQLQSRVVDRSTPEMRSNGSLQTAVAAVISCLIFKTRSICVWITMVKDLSNDILLCRKTFEKRIKANLVRISHWFESDENAKWLRDCLWPCQACKPCRPM